MKKSPYRQIQADHFPPEISLTIGSNILIYQKQIYQLNTSSGPQVGGLRYGENPGQEAALYRLVNGHLNQTGIKYVGPKNALVSALADSDPKNNMMYGCGKHPSKTNLTDVDSALAILRYLMEKPAAVIIKHNNPSGAAYGTSIGNAFKKAYEADRVAAFGGAAVVNRPVTIDCARQMNKFYLEVVAAPDYEEGALEILSKKPDLRIFKIKKIDKLKDYAGLRYLDIKSLMDGGLVLQQSSQNAILSVKDFQMAQAEHQGKIYKPERKPTPRELKDLLFGWAVEQGVVSNSVLFVKNEVTVAIGGGGQDRVGIADIAVFKARQKYADVLCFKQHKMSYKELELLVEKKKADPELLAALDDETAKNKGGLIGSAMISDAFFPFRDGIDVGLKNGASAVAHPGGSMRDWEVIEAANEYKAALVFTGQRAFKH